MREHLPTGVEQRSANTFRFTVYNGSIGGEQQRFRKTVTLPEGMTEKARIRELSKLIAEYRVEVEKGAAANGKQLTFEAFAALWLEKYVSLHDLAPKTVQIYTYSLENHLIPAFGATKLRNITPLQLTKFYADKLKERCKSKRGRGETLSADYVLHFHRLIRVMLNTAVDWNLIAVNPALRAHIPKDDTPHFVPYTREQCAALIKALEDEPIDRRAAITTALFTQVRRGELVALDWDNIDFEKRMISIRRNAVYIPKAGVTIKSPKTESSVRDIPVSDIVLDVLSELRLQQKKDRLRLGETWTNSGAVFVQWDGQRIHPDTPGKWFDKVQKRAGLPHIRFHDLRHSGASLLIASGTDIETVAHRLGHSKPSVTMDIYGHPYDHSGREASDLLERIIAPKQVKSE